MRASLWVVLTSILIHQLHAATEFTSAPQQFRQEIARSFKESDGLTSGRVQLIDVATGNQIRAFASGQWFLFQDERWRVEPSLTPGGERQFVFADARGRAVQVPVPWADVTQLLRFGSTQFVATASEVFSVENEKSASLAWPNGQKVNQIAVSPEGSVHVASSGGLFRQLGKDWTTVEVADGVGRNWGVRDVLGVAFDQKGQLWFAVKAGVGCRTSKGWKFYEGKDGLPWNDFTGIAAGPEGEVWFSTRLGAIRFDGKEWGYRQGPLWLPHDEVVQVTVDERGTAWFGTAGGVGSIGRRPMTLAQKAEVYEQEIEHYVKRTPFGYVAEASLRKPGDKSSADPQDSDNDGLWTAMYGAGECFAYGATKDDKAKKRGQQAFEALRFLQKVTQGGAHAPPKGFIARTIRPIEWPDPNAGQLEGDREANKRDRLWKDYEPRWPKSADGKWYWKSDTSSDELDGHFFFYPLYYDLCAETESERERVRDVVRDVADHLLTHDFVLIDHDGRPTRWAVYGPQFLNRDPNWMPERGLNSLSLLAYLAVAGYVTGDEKYAAASRDLIDHQGYAQNILYAKLQHGPGSGNQSDDEMAFMCYYGLLRYSKDEPLKGAVRYSFFHYWVNEAPEMNPFFNFAYAAHNLQGTSGGPWGPRALKPWPSWHGDAMATLYGLPLDRLNWPHRNSHRLDLVELARVHSGDLDEPDPPHQRAYRVNGKVLPVENRQFNHWNTDPWELDYGGNGGELAAGTVFLLPYYMGLYHGFIERP